MFSKGMLREYEQWQLTSPFAVPATRLYSLAPIGVGTPTAESLTGYIARLAEAHCVSAGLLYGKEIKALVGKGNIFTFRVTEHRGYSTHTINGHGSPAADFVRVLEMLTGRRDLRFLTVLTWAQVLPGYSLMRRSRAWCDLCFQERLQAKQPVYEPLLWTMRAVKVCPNHRRRLCDVCPHCGCRMGPFDWRSRPGYCSKCEGLLVRVDRAPGPEAPAGDELIWATWAATALGELIAAAPGVVSPPTRDRLAQTITACVDHASSGNASDFARLMHVANPIVGGWQRGRTLPPVELLLNMAFRMGISLLDFLLGTSTGVSSGTYFRSPPVEPERKPRRATIQRGSRVNRADVVRILHAALDESPPPGVTQVMKRFSCSESAVRYHFPELCRELAKKHLRYRMERSAERKVQAAEEVKRLAHSLHGQGIRLTHRHIRPMLTRPDLLNLEEGRAALREVRREFDVCANKSAW